MTKSTGRLRLHFSTRARLRDNEIRWIGSRVQWVISGVQVALWTRMHRSIPQNRLQLAPLPRS